MHGPAATSRPALDKVDPVWTRIRREAEEVARREPEIALVHLFESILHHDTLEAAVVQRIAERLDHADVSGELIRQAYADALEESRRSATCSAPTSSRSTTATRRPTASSSRCSTTRASTPSRPTGWRTGCGARAARISPITCRAARRRCSSATSIRPRASAAAFSSITPPGLSCGETAVIDDDVSMLHDVTLGGTGKETGDRHPKIRHGVMIGAGAKILGNIEVGHCARIAAGSVVLKAVPNNVDRRRRSGEGGRRGGLRRAVAHHGPDAQRSRPVTPGVWRRIEDRNAAIKV